MRLALYLWHVLILTGESLLEQYQRETESGLQGLQISRKHGPGRACASYPRRHRCFCASTGPWRLRQLQGQYHCWALGRQLVGGVGGVPGVGVGLLAGIDGAETLEVVLSADVWRRRLPENIRCSPDDCTARKGLCCQRAGAHGHQPWYSNSKLLTRNGDPKCDSFNYPSLKGRRVKCFRDDDTATLVMASYSPNIRDAGITFLKIRYGPLRWFSISLHFSPSHPPGTLVR